MLAPFDFKGLNNNEAETCVFVLSDKKTWRGKHLYEVSLKNFHCNVKCHAQWSDINLLQIQRIQWAQKKTNCFNKFDWLDHKKKYARISWIERIGQYTEAFQWNANRPYCLEGDMPGAMYRRGPGPCTGREVLHTRYLHTRYLTAFTDTFPSLCLLMF